MVPGSRLRLPGRSQLRRGGAFVHLISAKLCIDLGDATGADFQGGLGDRASPGIARRHVDTPVSEKQQIVSNWQLGTSSYCIDRQSSKMVRVWQWAIA